MKGLWLKGLGSEDDRLGGLEVYACSSTGESFGVYIGMSRFKRADLTVGQLLEGEKEYSLRLSVASPRRRSFVLDSQNLDVGMGGEGNWRGKRFVIADADCIVDFADVLPPSPSSDLAYLVETFMVQGVCAVSVMH